MLSFLINYFHDFFINFVATCHLITVEKVMCLIGSFLWLGLFLLYIFLEDAVK